MTFRGKEVRVVLSAQATEEYNELNQIVGDELKRGVTSSIHQSIFRSIERVKRWLKENPFAGDQVRKGQTPQYYVKKYGVTNLWRIELSNYWRLIYTIQSNEVEIIDFVLDIVDHKEYDKRFGYRRR
jgi:mRNA-degrading endonuclease RelE of RelBE toxin-antitoxin system